MKGMTRSTAHLQQPLPLLALVSAVVRLKLRLVEQAKLPLKRKNERKPKVVSVVGQ
jgi:hypothetical protein